MSELKIILTTIENKETANKLVKSIIKQKLAVCALISKETAIYSWQNNLEESEEYLIKFKTIAALTKDLKLAIKAEHSYEVCFIAEVQTTDCNAEYLDYANSYLLSK